MKHAGREVLNAVLIALGILSAGMGLHGFLLSSNFIDGGVTGVSMLGADQRLHFANLQPPQPSPG